MKIKIIIIYLLLISNTLFPISYKLTLDKFEAGFFSVFHLTLGALDFYEKSLCDGLTIEFEDKGFYYDPAYGPNWLNYYFDIPKIGVITHQEKKFTNEQKVTLSLFAGLTMSRERGYELIQRYLHLKLPIQEKLDSFIEKNFAGNYVIGVHYRGTDKSFEAPSYSYIAQLINQEIINSIIKGTLIQNIKIFIATDDQQFLLYMQKNFPDKVICIEALRSRDGDPVHFPSQESNYKKGEEALIDCILLSKCSLLYKSESNLSNASLKFNPSIPSVNLNPEATRYYSQFAPKYLNI